MKRKSQLGSMNDSEDLKVVVIPDFLHEKPWKSSNNIKDEEASKVIVSNGRQFFVSSSSLDKVQADLNKVDDIDSKLNFNQSLIIFIFAIITTSKACDVNMLECKDIWRHEQSIDGQHGDDEVPYFAEGSLGVDQVPFQFWLRVDNLIFFICIFIDVVDHHFFQI